MSRGSKPPRLIFFEKTLREPTLTALPFFSLLLAGRVEPFQKVHKNQQRFEMKDRREEDLHDPD
nr:hypothetical protein [Desulforhabdus sp. TSK]